MDRRWSRRRSRAVAFRVFADFEPVVEWKMVGEEQDMVEISLPGFRQDQVRVQVDDQGVLRATGERPLRGGCWARFKRDLRLPDNCDADGVRARFEGEKLIITLPMVAPATPSPSPPPSPTLSPPRPPRRPPSLSPSPSPLPSNASSRMDDIYNGFRVLEHTIEGSEKPSNLKLPFLKHITNNFSDDLKIGHGGCGVIYKGILPNGTVAVKKLFNSHTIDDEMFHREVKSMMVVQHQNVVRFLGYCSHTEEQVVEMAGLIDMAQIRERLLCFEYISNGSLKNHITDELRGLEWHTRYQIIRGICEGLQHLHMEKHIIHMDLKPTNILLDDQFVPKITDFGLSRLDEKSQTLSSERLITLGYCAPEYHFHGKMSAKSDIYSLGVIIIELLTGSKETPSITKVMVIFIKPTNISSFLLLSV